MHDLNFLRPKYVLLVLAEKDRELNWPDSPRRTRHHRDPRRARRLFIGLGIAVFLLGTREVYQMLGIMYIAIGALRAVSMVIDKSVEQSNIISLVFEIVFGIILIL